MFKIVLTPVHCILRHCPLRTRYRSIKTHILSLSTFNNFRRPWHTGDLRPHWNMRMTSSKCVF